MRISYGEMIQVTEGLEPVRSSKGGHTHFRDYWIEGKLWRYTWTNYTLHDPEYVEVYSMFGEDE